MGNKLRSIPRLKSIGWGTIFKYLDTVTEVDTNSPEVVSSRLLGLLDSKGVKPEIIQKNLAAVSVDTQVSTMGAIDKAMITDQIKYTEDHGVLGVLNAQYFEEYPINIPFLISSIGDPKPFFGK